MAKPRKPGRPVDLQKGQNILTAARQLLFNEGPKALSMERVAHCAGVSKVTLYARYANRNALIQALVQAESSPIYQPLLTPAQTLPALHEQLRSMALAICGYIRSEQYRQLCVAMGSISQHSQDLATVYQNGPERAHQALTQALSQAARNGLVKCQQPHAAAEMLMGMILGLDPLRRTYQVELPAVDPQQLQAHAEHCTRCFLTLLAA
jgi:TetR/AcrR family transcriptional repressor of mexJK operon